MEYYWIGHCKEGTSDKVWGMIDLGHSELYPHPYARRFVIFWGKRGAKLRTKLTTMDLCDAHDMCYSKWRGGYYEVNKYNLAHVYPEFEEDLEKTAVWAMLSA